MESSDSAVPEKAPNALELVGRGHRKSQKLHHRKAGEQRSASHCCRLKTATGHHHIVLCLHRSFPSNRKACLKRRASILQTRQRATSIQERVRPCTLASRRVQEKSPNQGALQRVVQRQR